MPVFTVTLYIKDYNKVIIIITIIIITIIIIIIIIIMINNIVKNLGREVTYVKTLAKIQARRTKKWIDLHLASFF